MYIKHISERTNNRNQGIQPFLDLIASDTDGSNSNILSQVVMGTCNKLFLAARKCRRLDEKVFPHHPKTALVDCHPFFKFPKITRLLHFAHNIFGLSTQTIWNLQMSQTGVMLARKSDTRTGNHNKSSSWQKNILTRARRQWIGRGEERGESLGASPS